MKEKRLLYAIGWVKDEYIVEMNRPGTKNTRKRPSRRLWLIAAIIAVMLLLVGCVSVYLWLQDRSIGQETYTQRFDAEGHYIEPTEKTADIVTLFGSGGSDTQKALAEWSKFLAIYPDPWELNLTEADYAKIPDHYDLAYGCYTPEMMEELDRIVAKYDLKLLAGSVGIQRYQYESAMESLGLTSLLRSDARATMENGQGTLRLPYNFEFEFFMDLEGIEADWAKDIYVNISYAQTGYFPGFGTKSLDLSEYQQWQYTAADGTLLSLALNQKGQGLILTEREDAMIYIEVDGNLIGPNFPKSYEVINQEGFEQLADAFDYSIQPQNVDIAVLQPKLDADEAAYNQRMLDAVETYSGFTEYLLEKAHEFPSWYYCFYDLDNNGEEELLLGSTGTGARQCIVLYEGKAYERGMWFADLRPLENGGLLFRDMQTVYPDQSGQTSYRFYEPLPNGAALAFDFSGQASGAKKGELAVGLICEDETWKKYYPMQRGEIVISEAEAKAIIDQYPEKALDWQPLWNYPVDVTGRTLGQVMSERKNPVTREEAREFYAAAIQSGDVMGMQQFTHYALQDVTNDGVLDLLLSPDGEEIWFIYSIRYGKVYFWSSRGSMYLCGGNVLMTQEIQSAEDGADLEYYRFQYCEVAQNRKTLAEIQLNKASGIWTDLQTGETIAAERASEIIEKHPRILVAFYPIEELSR